jgi:hypothetical protein
LKIGCYYSIIPKGVETGDYNMFALAIFDSGNYALNLCRILERKGYVFELISTPCRIASTGCSYCIKFPMEFMNVIINEGTANNMPVREIYRIVSQPSRNLYEKVL